MQEAVFPPHSRRAAPAALPLRSQGQVAGGHLLIATCSEQGRAAPALSQPDTTRKKLRR